MKPPTASSSILEFLTKANPEVEYNPNKSTKATNHTKSSTAQGYFLPKVVKPWTDFTFETFTRIFNGQLFDLVRQDTTALPPTPYLTLVDCVIADEKSTKHLLTKWSHSIVHPALDIVPKHFNACCWTPISGQPDKSGPQSGEDITQTPTPTPPSSAQKKTTKKSRRLIPDGGTRLICSKHGIHCESSKVERLPKEIKPATKFRSSMIEQHLDGDGKIMLNRSHGSIRPLGQAFTYSIDNNCRYGCILTTEEIFIFRISPSSFDESKTFRTCITTDGLMEYAAIPWKKDSADDFTFNLALWFIHILAGNDYKPGWRYKDLWDEQLIPPPSCQYSRPPSPPQSQPPSNYMTPPSDPFVSRAVSVKFAEPPSTPTPNARGKRRRASPDIAQSFVDSFVDTSQISEASTQPNESGDDNSSQQHPGENGDNGHHCMQTRRKRRRDGKE